MSEDLRSITLKTIPDAIQLLNESSQGTSLEYHLEFFDFLALKRFWDFAPAYSLIRYIDNEPAAIAIHCVDPQAREAYNFYWGTLPKFRNAKLSLSLFDTCCQKLHEDGYVMLYADALPERPVRRYRFAHAFPQHNLVDLRAVSPPQLPSADSTFEIRKIDTSVLSQLAPQPDEIFHWTQRHSFLRNIEYCVDFVGAFTGNHLQAYAVVRAKPAETILFDLRSHESCFPAGYELLRFVTEHYPSPISVRYLLQTGYSHRLLTDAGFAVVRQYSTLYRDLRTTRTSQVA